MYIQFHSFFIRIAPARKQTLWTLRKVSTRISKSMPPRLIRVDIFRLQWIICSGKIDLYIYPPETECVGPD